MDRAIFSSADRQLPCPNPCAHPCDPAVAPQRTTRRDRAGLWISPRLCQNSPQSCPLTGVWKSGKEGGAGGNVHCTKFQQTVDSRLKSTGCGSFTTKCMSCPQSYPSFVGRTGARWGSGGPGAAGRAGPGHRTTGRAVQRVGEAQNAGVPPARSSRIGQSGRPSPWQQWTR